MNNKYKIPCPKCEDRNLLIKEVELNAMQRELEQLRKLKTLTFYERLFKWKLYMEQIDE